MASRSITGIELCAGVGWLGLGVKLAWEHFGHEYRAVSFAERDAYAASVLVARMEESSLEQAAVCDGIEDIDERFGGVDCVVAGFPCPPVSVAGKQLGRGDDRWIWPQIIECIRRVGPRWVFLENVPGLLSAESGAACREVLGSLAALGFDAEWTTLSAAEVGASHKRDRWFCVAHSRREHSELQQWPQRIREHQGSSEPVAYIPLRGQRELRESPRGDGQPDGGDEAVGDTTGARCATARKRQPQQSQRWECMPSDGRSHLADTISPRQQERGSERRDNGSQCSTAERDCLPLFAPGPAADWSEIPEWLWPAIDKATAQSEFLRVVDGRYSGLDDPRADRLRCVGNGVVVLQAAAAFVGLMRRFG